MKIDRRILKLNYRNYELVARYFEEAYRGRVWRDNKRVSDEDVIEDTLEQVVAALYQQVDELIQQKAQLRGTACPTLEEYMDAIQAVKAQISASFLPVLVYHAKHAGTELATLAELGGYASATDLMLDYADFAKMLCDQIAYFPKAGNQVSDANLLVLFETQGEAFNICQHSLTLREALCQAINAIKNGH